MKLCESVCGQVLLCMLQRAKRNCRVMLLGISVFPGRDDCGLLFVKNYMFIRLGRAAGYALHFNRDLRENCQVAV